MAHLSDRQKAELVRQHLDGVPWTRIAEHSGVTVRTLQRWAARIDAGQLARPPRRDKGASRTPTELVKGHSSSKARFVKMHAPQPARPTIVTRTLIALTLRSFRLSSRCLGIGSYSPPCTERRDGRGFSGVCLDVPGVARSDAPGLSGPKESCAIPSP